MQLSRALRITPGAALALTGAGGKSAAMRCLAREATRDLPVILTTTTHLATNQSNLANGHLVVAEGVDREAIEVELDRLGSLLVTGPRLEAEPRWTSPGNEALIVLHQVALNVGALLVVEADGSRGKSIKAPAAHEPLVPSFTNTLAPVVSATAFGAALSDDHVHRPELASELLGEPLGVSLTPDRVAQLVGSTSGGLKGRPEGAEVRVIINQVDGPDRHTAAEDCAGVLLQDIRIRSVVLGSLMADDPVRQVMGRVAGVILAAGGSSRLGRPKLLELWKGEPLLRYAVRSALDGGLGPVVVVLGDRAEELARMIEDLPVERVINRDWADGQASSLRLGLGDVESDSEAVVFLLGDMPLVAPGLIKTLVRAHASSLAPIVMPHAEGRRGNPVLFDRSTFETLSQIEGDTGGRAVFDQFDILQVEGNARGFFDFDTQADLDWLNDQA